MIGYTFFSGLGVGMFVFRRICDFERLGFAIHGSADLVSDFGSHYTIVTVIWLDALGLEVLTICIIIMDRIPILILYMCFAHSFLELKSLSANLQSFQPSMSWESHSIRGKTLGTRW